MYRKSGAELEESGPSTARDGHSIMRPDETAAETLGVKIFRSKLYSFLIAAFVTGAAGGALYIYQVFIQPNSAFGMDWSSPCSSSSSSAASEPSKAPSSAA